MLVISDFYRDKVCFNNLYSKILKQVVVAMVKIAHPNHQERIEREYFNLVNGKGF
jgi:hypothetical protein